LLVSTKKSNFKVVFVNGNLFSLVGAMKVEVISIGTELLVSDILDTNAAFISRSMREAQVQLTCKVTVGDNLEMIADVIRVGLKRADVVLTTGGLGSEDYDFTRRAVSAVTGRRITSRLPGIAGATLLGGVNGQPGGILIEGKEGAIICLPGNRREMAFLLETEVFPYLRERMPKQQLQSGYVLLRSVGVVESSLKQELAAFLNGAHHKITFDSFAGQTNIRIWAEAESDDIVQEELERLKVEVMSRLGDHIFGFEQDRLENVVYQSLEKANVKLALAECFTDRILTQTLGQITNSNHSLTLLPTSHDHDLAKKLELEEVNLDNLSRWCRTAAERLLETSDSDLGLVVYNNVTQGGIQILVTLASSFGVSVTQRSFGGHPDNINQWAFTLGLSHLRRWLLVHR
jgi:nicotinamide-nucleotide amidase